jgi:hypothetical protein
MLAKAPSLMTNIGIHHESLLGLPHALSRSFEIHKELFDLIARFKSCSTMAQHTKPPLI